MKNLFDEDLTFYHKSFDELSPAELYAILHLRAQVFVLEQQCPYLDPDYLDLSATHLCGMKNQVLCGYARILPPGSSYDHEASIGRVVTSPSYRHKGLGLVIVERALVLCHLYYPEVRIRISAQLHLTKFYAMHGFKEIGLPYLEDGIPHIGMIK